MSGLKKLNNKLFKKIRENLFFIFFLLYVLIYIGNYVNATSVKNLNSLTYILFTILTVLLGFAIVKDVILRWNKKQNELEGKIKAEINESIKKELKETDYNKNIEECELRTQKYRDLLSLNPNDYLFSIFFSFLALLLSTLSSIFLEDKPIWNYLNTKGYNLTFLFFWIGLYYLLKHLILFISIMQEE